MPDKSTITAIPAPVSAVVVVMSYNDAQTMYAYIKATPGLPSVFETFAAALLVPIE